MPSVSLGAMDFSFFFLTGKRHEIFGPARSSHRLRLSRHSGEGGFRLPEEGVTGTAGAASGLAPEHPLPTPQGGSCTCLPPGTLFGPHPVSPDSTTEPGAGPGLPLFASLSLRLNSNKRIPPYRVNYKFTVEGSKRHLGEKEGLHGRKRWCAIITSRSDISKPALP